MFVQIINKSRVHFALALLTGSLITACSPEENGIGNGLTDPNVDASFTITAVDGDANSFMLQAATENVLRYSWDVGNGFYNAAAIDTIFLPDAGSYTVTHQALGRGGAVNTTSQEIDVATSDPVAGNIIQGGKFEDQAAREQWTVLNISETGANWSFNDGFATITASDYNQQGIYQAVEVEANKEYTIDMRVFSAGTDRVWFEVYASAEPPVQGTEYKAGGIVMGTSSFDGGCGFSEYDGRLSQLNCVSDGNTVTFDQSGTVYLVLRSGGVSTGSTGISVTNIEMRGKRE